MSLADQQWLTARAKVSVLQARGLRVKGKEGAYALLQVGSQKFSTPKGQQQLADPVWEGQEAAFELASFPENSATLHVQVLQRALVGPDKQLGQTDIDLGELYDNKSRNKTEWFKLFGKPGKPEKDRGAIMLDIQFLKGSMSASMFDLSSNDKSRSKIGKLKDKLRGKKKEGLSDSASAIVPSVTQVMTDSEGEEEEEPASGEKKKKKNKLKSLFAPKSSLQRNASQSMSTLSTLPERDSAIASSTSSGLNAESPEGKKKFKLFTHKRNSSTDSRASQSGFVSKQSGPPMVCINGSHVYSEEPETKGSTLSLTSSGHGSMEELRREKEERERLEGDRREREAEEERIRAEKDEEDRKRKEREEEDQRQKIEKERMRMEKEKEEQRRKVEEEKERMRIEKEKEEQRRKVEEEKERMRMEKEQEEQRRKVEEERKRKEREEEEQRRTIEEEKERIRIEREKEEQRRKVEEERKRKAREEEEQKKNEEERKRMEKEKEEQRKKIEEERKIKEREEEEQRRKLEEKRKEREAEEQQKVEQEKERMRMEKEKEEQRRKFEEERKRQEREAKEQRRKLEEEERERKRVEEEEKRLVEEKQKRTEAEKRLREEEKRKLEMEKRLAEEKRVREEEESRRRMAEEEAGRQKREEEEKRVREQEERMKVERERKRREEERKMHEEEERREKERLRMEEEKRNVEMEERRNKERRMKEEEKEKQQKKERETKEAEKEERPVPKARSGKVSSAAQPEKPQGELPPEGTSSFNPFDLSFAEDASSTNPFEESTTSQSVASVRSARVSAVKPSASISETVPQLPVMNTNPFLDDDDSVEGSLENLNSIEKSTARKKRAPLPPQNKPEMSTPNPPYRGFLVEDTKHYSKEVSKRPAPVPPSSLKKTTEEPVKENIDQPTVALGQEEKETPPVPGNHQTSKVAPISKDELKAWCIQSMTAKGQNSSPQKMDPNNNQATTGHADSQISQNLYSKKETDTNPFTCGGTVAARHNKGPAPARPSSTSSRKSLSEDEPSSHSTSLTGVTVQPEGVSTNMESKDNPSNLKAMEGPESLVAEDTTVADLPGGKEVIERLHKMNEPESLKFITQGQDLCSESLDWEPDQPNLDSSAPETDALTGSSKKKSRAPLPPAKPKRVGDPDAPNQQQSFPTTSEASLGHVQESQSNKKDQDKAEDIASVIYPSVTASSSLLTSLAEESRVTKACVSMSADTGSGSGTGSRALPCARVVPTDSHSIEGEMKGAGRTPASVIRPHAVKPLNAADKQLDTREANSTLAADATDRVQPETEATEGAGKGPYSQLTRAELISLLVRQQEQLSQRNSRITELEQYIDNLLVRVMEEQPSILMSITSQKKAV